MIRARVIFINLNELLIELQKMQNNTARTAVRIRWSSPTQLLIDRSTGYEVEIGRDRHFSAACGRA